MKLLFSLFIPLAIPLTLDGQEAESSPACLFIVNVDKKVSKLKRSDLVRIYLGKKTLWASGVKIAPAMLSEKNPTTQDFIEGILQKSVGQYRAYWKRRLFSGAGTLPKSFRTNSEVVEFVAKNPGAVGIVDDVQDDERIRLIEIVD